MTSKIYLDTTWTQLATGDCVIEAQGRIALTFSATAPVGPVASVPHHVVDSRDDDFNYSGTDKAWALALEPGSLVIVSGAAEAPSKAPVARVAPVVTALPSMTPPDPVAGDIVAIDPGTATAVPDLAPEAELIVGGERVALDTLPVRVPRAGAWSLKVIWRNGVAPNAIATAFGVVGIAAESIVTPPDVSGATILSLTEFSRDRTLFDSGAHLLDMSARAVEVNAALTGPRAGMMNKVWGVNAAPAGMTQFQETVTIDTSVCNEAAATGWLFDNLAVVITGDGSARLSGAQWAATDCWVNCVAIGVANTPENAMKVAKTSSNIHLDHWRTTVPNTYITPGGATEGAKVSLMVEWSGTTPSLYATNITITNTRVEGGMGDPLILGGHQIRFTDNYVAARGNFPAGTLPYDPGVTYNTGDPALSSDGYGYFAQLDGITGPTNAPPTGKASNTNWVLEDIHLDLGTIVASDNVEIARNLMTFLPTPDTLNIGPNNVLRYAPNSGDNPDQRGLRVHHNIFIRPEGLGSMSVQVVRAGGAWEAPQFYENLFAGVNAGRALYTPANNGQVIWQDNRDYTTRALLDTATANTLREDGLSASNNAAVLLSGGSDATAGEIVQGRSVSTEDGGATTTAWRDIATVAGDGSWFGTLDTPRSASWYRPEVRLKAAPAVSAAGTNRFGVGVIVWIEDQSLFMYHLLPSLSDPSNFVSVPDPEAVQLIMAENRQAPTEEDLGVVAPVRFLSDAAQGSSWYTASMSQMARTIALNAPGLKTLLICDVKEGTGQAEVLQDAAGLDVRKFAVSAAIADLAHADGAVVGIVQNTHDKGIADQQDVPTYLENWLPNVLFATDKDGVPLPALPSPGSPIDIISNEFGGTKSVDHLFAEIFPEFASHSLVIDSQNGRGHRNLQGATLLFPSGTTQATDLMDPGTWTSLFEIGDPAYWQYIHRRDQIAANPFLASKVIEGPLHTIAQPDSADGIHQDNIDPYNGTPEHACARMASWLQGSGIVPKPIPVVDNVFWAPDGAYVDIWSSAGPITTKQKLHGLPPLDGSSVYDTDVMGLQYNGPNGQEFVHRAEIVDSTGTPASEGRIRVYPQAGDTFTGATRLYYYAADGFAGTSKTDVFNRKLNRFRPIVRQGWQHFDGFMLNPGQDVEVINAANPLALPVGYDVYTTVSGAPMLKTPSVGSGNPRLTIEAKLVRSGGDSTAPGPFIIRGTTGTVSAQSYYSVAIDDLANKISVTIKNAFSGGTTFVGTITLPDGELAASGVSLPTIRLVADLTTGVQYLRLFVRNAATGVETEWLSTSPGVTAATGNLFGVAAGAAGTGFQGAGGALLGNVGFWINEAFVYDISYIRFWLAAQSDGGTDTLGAVWAEAVSDGAGGFSVVNMLAA